MLHARRRTLFASGLSGVLTATAIFAIVAGPSILSGSTAQAADSSAVTVTAKELDLDYATTPFPDLKVTVSQTRALEAQGITVSWTGGKQSTVPNQQFGGGDFLQVFQCWGDDPEHPGTPDRTTCQYGVTGGNPGSQRDSVRDNDASVAPEDAKYTAPGDGFASPTYTSVPFRAVDGVTIESVSADHKKLNVDVNSHQYFTKFTTNMVQWAGSGADGSGSVKFELQTAMQSKGLGCGSPVTASNGSVTPQSCWLVILPRGTADSGSPSITQSGLFWDAWKHRIAVRLEFKLIGERCPIGAPERQLAGSELVGRAISSWQPIVCNQDGGAVYSALTIAESDAAIAANGVDAAPLALTSRPLNAENATDSLRYAPIAISGAAISFAIDRAARSDAPADVQGRERTAFTDMKLTPRLVAKLLTNSYLDSVPIRGDRDHLSHMVGGAPVFNPRNLTFDPDFLDVNKDNPDWQYQGLAAASIADALVPQGRSDVAWALWQYVRSDASARDFLNGTPDPWGMTVNPWSSTNDGLNPTGAGLALPREDFPKADPIEQPAETGGAGIKGPVNLITWRPYVNDLDSGAYLTLRGDGQLLGDWNPTVIPPKYDKSARLLPGLQQVLAVTDTASAARYQVVTASLLNPAGQFVKATAESMTAAAAAMTPNATQPQVYGFDPDSSAATGAAGAYPLTMPVYAAVNPKMNDASLRASYASFIRFATTDGQDPGTSLGQLPDGYAPLPAGWRAEAAAAADDIEMGTVPGAEPSASPSAPTNSPAGIAFPSPRVAAPVAPPRVAPSPSASAPAASGDAAPVLSGGKTPDDPPASAISIAFPASLLGGAACAAAVPLMSRRRHLN